MIEVKNLKKEFGKAEAKVNALNGINLVINRGEMVAIVGPSGSGKTTLLNILGCIDKPTSGQYILNGKDIAQYTHSEMAIIRNTIFGFIIQDFALINEYTVYQNICLPIRYNKNLKESQKRTDIFTLLETLGISDKANTYPNKLSGGQKQRVAIARALINNPQIILADEPTGALDRKNSDELIMLLREINRSGKTIIIVTHDSNIASQCDRILEVEDGVIKV